MAKKMLVVRLPLAQAEALLEAAGDWEVAPDTAIPLMGRRGYQDLLRGCDRLRGAVASHKRAATRPHGYGG